MGTAYGANRAASLTNLAFSEEETIPYQRVFVPVDGSPPSTRALEEAIRLAAEQHARLRIVHVSETPLLYGAGEIYPTSLMDDELRKAGEAILARAAATARQRAVESETVLLENVEAPIARAIIEDAKAWGADLIVLGTHGRHGLDRLLLGSVAVRVARLASVPVLLVHGQ